MVSDFSPVAKEKIWREHLEKLATTQQRYRLAAPHDPTFTVNPFRMSHDRPLPEPIVRRERRFLNKEHAALRSLVQQLARRMNDAALREKFGNLLDDPAMQATVAQVRSQQQQQQFDQDHRTTSLPPIKGAPVDLKDNVRTLLDKVHKAPTQKYAAPQTEAQELGWGASTIGALQPPTATMFCRGLKSCDVTKFAQYAKKVSV